MGHSLGLEIVAEGVETAEQLGILQALDCDQIQGYFVSEPVPAAVATVLLAESAGIRQKILACADARTHTQPALTGDLGPVQEMLGILNEPPAAAAPGSV